MWAYPLDDLTSDVMPFSPDMLPAAIRDYIFDVADRQQCPPDFVAITTIVGLSGLLGRKILIRPKQNDDWTVTPNQWGIIIGRPSAMKSPSMREALRSLDKFERESAQSYKNCMSRFAAEQKVNELDKKGTNNTVKNLLKNHAREDAIQFLINESLADDAPVRSRLIVNDSSIEKLGELLNENSNGLILVRDELSGWLSKLSKEEFQSDRAFYLECFDGNGRYTYDRIGRGTVEIKNCTLSVIGGIQPSKIASLVREAVKGIADDGLLQRFQLVTWPTGNYSWEWRDQEPNHVAKASYESVFEKLHDLEFTKENDEPICLRFSSEAQLLFIEWMIEIQSKARSENIHVVLESYMLKMPQTIAGLALLFEVIEDGSESVGVNAAARALKWANYLISHATYLYGCAANQVIENARLILNRKDKLTNPFTARDIQRKNWSCLDTNTAVTDALDCLIDHRYLISIEVSSTHVGGRPTLAYQWNVFNEGGR